MTMQNFQPMLSSRPIRDIAYEVLKCSIMSGDIAPGSRIVETEYAEQMHISRTPLREALHKLEQDGLVEYIPHKGVVVRAFSVEDVEEIYTIRNALEMLTLPAIIEKATAEDIAGLRRQLRAMDVPMQRGEFEVISPMARDFHQSLTQICGQKRILQVLNSQDEYIRQFSAMSIRQEDHLIAAHKEHYQLVDYVEQKDLEGFKSLMEKHINRSREMCIASISLRRKRSTDY